MLSKTISPKELHNNLDNVKLGIWSLIDVRSVSEYRAGHIPMAALMPFGHTTKTAQQINPDAMTVLYCRTGNRSGEEAQELSGMGFNNVYSLDGGLTNWISSGFPVEEGR